MKYSVHIKNMVCPRCIETVSNIFNELGIEFISIRLGEVIALSKISKVKKKALTEKLELNGFELLESYNSQLINQIKSIIVDQIHHKKEALNINFSTLLSEQLHHEYTSMSKLFSLVEGITIEKFILKQKVERVKELLFYDELTLTEISYRMNYSSVAHLSAQFKKETGMPPSEFKKMRKPERRYLDDI